MKIALIGGIYGRPPGLRAVLQHTPETVLEKGLCALGHEVRVLSHYEPLLLSDVDVVHVHHLSYGAIRAGCDKSQTPFVFTLHEDVESVSFPRSCALRFVLSRVDALISLSERERQAHISGGWSAGALQRVVYNGIDSRIFRYRRRYPKSGLGARWKLLFVGQLIGLKNVDVLLKAVAKLPENVQLDLVFHNGEQEGALRGLAKVLGVSQRVHFLGGRPPEELCRAYQEADILVLPSAREALPSVIGEAMMCGTPVVASDVGGVREQVRDYGILVPPNDEAALHSAIRDMIETYPRFVTRAEEMWQTTYQRFSIATMVRQHAEVYEEVLRRLS